MAIVTKKVLAEKLADKCGSKAKATELVNELFDTIVDSLQNGDTVDVFGFGKFEVKERAERQGLNPSTKEKITIPAKKVPGFKASKALKDAVK